MKKEVDTMVAGLTEKQEEVLRYLMDYVARNRFAPSAKEIAERFGIAEKNAFYYLAVLERKGYIRRRRKTPRVVEFTAMGGASMPVSLPVVGRVQAGRPVTAVENLEGEIVVDSTIAGDEKLFVLRVTGDSMSGAHILEGDLALVRPQKSAEHGEIVVALTGDDATVKRIFFQEGSVVLHAENPLYEDMVFEEGGELEIVGKVVGVIRKF